MKLKQLFEDDDAVSPVIGVILMVAITVILAAVIGTFVLGLGDRVSTTPPSASFSFDYTEGERGECNLDTSGTTGQLEVTHDGGDKLDLTSVTVQLADGDDGPNAWGTCISGTITDSEITAGNSATATVDSDDTVRVTWTGEDGSDSSTLAKWEGPDS